MKYAVFLIAISLALGGCAGAQDPAARYYDATGRGVLVQAASLRLYDNTGKAGGRAPKEAKSPCVIAGPSAMRQASNLGDMPLTAGDLVRVTLPGEDSPMGVFKVQKDGTLPLSGIGDVPVEGLRTGQAERQLEHMLAALHGVHSGYGHASLHLLDSGTDRINWLAQCMTQPGDGHRDLRQVALGS